MPFQSEKQRRFMWAKEPAIAKKWAAGKHSSKGPHKMPKESAALKGLKSAKPKP